MIIPFRVSSNLNLIILFHKTAEEAWTIIVQASSAFCIGKTRYENLDVMLLLQQGVSLERRTA